MSPATLGARLSPVPGPRPPSIANTDILLPHSIGRISYGGHAPRALPGLPAARTLLRPHRAQVPTSLSVMIDYEKCLGAVFS